MSPGSSYGIGNTLNAIPAAGIGTTTGFVPAVLTVSAIQNNINDVIQLDGFTDTYKNYNNVYKLNTIQNSKKITVSSASTIYSEDTIITGDYLDDVILIHNGPILNASSFVYNATTGNAIIGFTTSHGLFVGNTIHVVGANS
jgi:hypothetical protein